MQPNKVNILGKEYKIIYVDNPAEVDVQKRESLWGQVDYWTRTIRVYRNERTLGDIWETLIHEILHAIDSELELELFSNKDKEKHKNCGRIGIALADVLLRNNWLKIENEKSD